MVEALGIDQQQGEALLRRQVAQEAGREVIEGLAILLAEELREARIVGLGLTHRIGMAAQLGEPELVDLGEGPAIERGPALITVLLGKHELQRAAQQRRALLAPADEKIGKALQPRQHRHKAGPDGIVEFFCLH